jgi:hypothetical protein
VNPHVLAVPVISKPPNLLPEFGGTSVILFGGIDKEAMRRWQERVGTAKSNRGQAAGADRKTIDHFDER